MPTLGIQTGIVAVNPLLFDQLALILFLVLSVGYHTFYMVVMRHHHDWSARARMDEHRLSWIESVQKRGERIMAVQSLRNLIMTNTFLASTMILLVAFIANYMVLSELPAQFVHPRPDAYTGAMPVYVKGSILVLLYAFAFTMFLGSLRNLNHLSILVGVESDRIQATEGRDPVHFMAAKLHQIEAMTTAGRRAVYFSLPVFTWFFSPWLFTGFTIGMWGFFVFVTDFVRPVSQRAPAVETRPATPPLPGSK